MGGGGGRGGGVELCQQWYQKKIPWSNQFTTKCFEASFFSVL